MRQPAGWYEDPAAPGGGTYRYFDGESWTFHVTSNPLTSPLGLPPVLPEPTPRLSPVQVRALARYRRNRRIVAALAALVLGGALLTQLPSRAPSDGGVPVAAPAPAGTPEIPSMPTDGPSPAPAAPAAPLAPAVTGGPSRAEFAASASRVCSRTAATVSGFDLRVLEDRTSSPGRLPHAISGAYGLLAEELSALPKPPADVEAIDKRFVTQVRTIARETSALAAEVDRVYATEGYDRSVAVLTGAQSPKIDDASRAMAAFEAEYGISCRAG